MVLIEITTQTLIATSAKQNIREITLHGAFSGKRTLHTLKECNLSMILFIMAIYGLVNMISCLALTSDNSSSKTS